MEQSDEVEDISVPLSAKLVKVTNVIDPFAIRIYEVKQFNEKIDAINIKLTSMYQKGYFQSLDQKREPALGDHLIVHNQWNENIELPAWLCRGIICAERPDKSKYNILLIDYGICIELDRKGFKLVSEDLISQPSISCTASLHNVLPTKVRKGSQNGKEKPVQIISEEWSTVSVELTMDLFSVANEVYFDQLYTDENSTKYGEFYLDIQDEIICLADALFLHGHAIRIDKTLLRSIKNPDPLNQCIVNNEQLYCLDDTNNIKSNQLKRLSLKKSIKSLKPNEVEIYGDRITERDRQKVLVFTKVKCEFLTSVSDAKFPSQIHMAWKDMICSSRLKKLQAYTWPAIKKGLDVLAIGTKGSGKTLGLATAVCGALAATKNLPRGREPAALILCTSSSQVSKVCRFYLEFLREYTNIKVVTGINGKSDRTLAAEMFNGCQVLITTPNFITRFMDRNKKLLTFEKLRFLVFDDADVILEKYMHSVKRLICIHEIARNRHSDTEGVPLQIIMAARHWTKNLKRMSYALLRTPFICIASFLEAAVFRSVRPKLCVMDSRYKAKKLLEILTDEYKSTRTMIFCANADEANELHSFLSEQKGTVVAHEGMRSHTIKGIKSCWNASNPGSYPVFICTDDVLPDLDITNVEWLIHYSISLPRKTRFNYRYSTLHDGLLRDKCECKVTILADETNDVQFQSIVGIMQRMNVVLSPEMWIQIEHMAAALEQKKKNYPICNNVKSLGICPEKNSCPFRHCVIQEVDDPITDIRINDQVKFMAISIHNAGHISARIVSYIRSDSNEEITFSNIDYMTLFGKMRAFYSEVENRRTCESLNVGDLCTLEESLDDFKRVQIIYVELEERTEKPKYIDVRCIDNGVITYHVNPYKLLYIPEELRKLPCQVVELFLSNVAPPDNEYTWDATATQLLRKWFKDNVDERSYIIGTVSLHLGNTIWVDTLQVGTKIIGYEDLIASSLKQELIENDLAVVNDQHINKLYKLCKNAGYISINGIDIPTTVEVS